MLKICKNCNKEFDGRYNQLYCKKCGKINVNCDYCNKIYTVTRTEFNKSKTHCCSKECNSKLKWKDENFKETQKNKMLKQWNNTEYKNKMIKVLKNNNKKLWEQDWYKELKSKQLIERNIKNWENKDYREHMINIIKEYCNTDNARKRFTENMKNNWENDEFRQKMSFIQKENLLYSFPNPNWLKLTLKEKIEEEEKWIKENPNSKLLPYHKNNLELLKLKQSGQYKNIFSDIENDPDINNTDIGWVYGHIDTRTNELYYIGQTIRNPIERYAEHLALRKLGLCGNDVRFNSAKEYSELTGITKERIDSTKVVVLYKINKNDFDSDEEFRKILNELEENCIKNFIPKMNFYNCDLRKP